MMKTSKKGLGISIRGKARAAFNQYALCLRERRFSEAERSLRALKELSFQGAEFREGYLNALEGLLQSVRTGDERDFYNRMGKDEASLVKYYREFDQLRRSPVRTEFDRGYFTAWMDFLGFLGSQSDPVVDPEGV